MTRAELKRTIRAAITTLEETLDGLERQGCPTEQRTHDAALPLRTDWRGRWLGSSHRRTKTKGDSIVTSSDTLEKFGFGNKQPVAPFPNDTPAPANDGERFPASDIRSQNPTLNQKESRR